MHSAPKIHIGFIYENLCVVGIGWIWIWKEINSNIHKNIRVEFDPLLSFERPSQPLAGPGCRMLLWLVSSVHSAAVTNSDDEYILTPVPGGSSDNEPGHGDMMTTLSVVINISQWHEHYPLFYKLSLLLQGRNINKCGAIESYILCNLCTALSASQFLHNWQNCCSKFLNFFLTICSTVFSATLRHSSMWNKRCSNNNFCQ